MQSALPAPPLGLYVHIPYCRRKCAYCDFYSLARAPDPNFTDALIAELTQRRSSFPRLRPARSLYFGGGTPSRLDPISTASVVEHCRTWPGLEDEAEISLECNPIDLSAELCQAWREAGFNRLSLGIQSLDDRWLKNLGRLHSAEQARHALTVARTSGFQRISLDLILALPEQSLQDSARDVRRLIELDAGHLSVYVLTLEPGTPMHADVESGRSPAVDEDLASDMFDQAIDLLADAGYQRYEISNFARPGEEAVHNRLYWSGGEYLGLGPGAHSYLRQEHSARRFSMPNDLDAYLACFAEGQSDALTGLDAIDEILSPREHLLEGLAFGLRDLQGGGDLARLHAESGEKTWPALQKTLQELEDGGLILRQGERIKLTNRGTSLADAVAREILAVPWETQP